MFFLPVLKKTKRQTGIFHAEKQTERILSVPWIMP
jgi:hypothetical protein